MLPGGFGMFFCEVAIEDDPAVSEGIGVAWLEAPVTVFRWREVGEGVAAAVGGVRPDAEGVELLGQVAGYSG